MTERPRLEIAVYGLINAGKSSLINALVGLNHQLTGPVGGTTDVVTDLGWKEFDTEFDGFDVRLLDTPGLEEIGDLSKFQLATQAAHSAELVIFVIAEDLTDTALEALRTLHTLGKPIILALNKIDLFDETDEAAILGAIRDRIRPWVDPSLIVAVAAAPLIRERQAYPDGSTRIITKHGEPKIQPLMDVLRSAIIDSGTELKDINQIRTEVQQHTMDRELDRSARRGRAERVADETGLALALALAVNPIPLIDFLTGPSGLVILVTRVSAIYDERPTREAAQALAGELFKGGRFVLWGSMAAVLGGGAMKLLPGLGHLAGALTQGASAGYLSHVLGRGLVDYLENGHNWGDEGLVATLERIAARTDRKVITKGIVDQIRQQLKVKKAKI